MKAWAKFWKLSIILILASGPFISVELPWQSGTLLAASLLRATHQHSDDAPFSFVLPDSFVRLPQDMARPYALVPSAATVSSPVSRVTTGSSDTRPVSGPMPMPAQPYVVGRAIQLLPTGPTQVSLLSNGQIRFIATLTNEHNTLWHVTVMGTVELADGSKVTVLQPHSLWMVPGQKLRLPVALTADPQRFPPGWTQFKALLRDDQGQVIDQASVSFLLTLDLQNPQP
jgi:hypothetical protein